MSHVRARFIAAAAAAAALVALAAPLRAQIRTPPQQDEEAQRARRAAWLDSIHRAAPGVDWRVIEAANREELRLRLDGGGALPASASGAAAWVERGGDGNTSTGRNLCVASSALDPHVLYVGSALGGLWSGQVLGGGGWTPRTDPLGIGVKQIVVVPRPGRDDMILADGASMLVYTSDGGAHWSAPTGLPGQFWNARRLVQDAATPTRAFALVDHWYWTGTQWEVRTMVLRTEDAGATFTTLREETAAPGVDLWMDRRTGGTVWLLAGNVLRRSTDHGANFVLISTIPGGASDAGALAGSEAGAPKLYVVRRSGGAWTLYSTANTGSTWQAHPVPFDCWGVIGACISDSAQVLLGGVECHRSRDGGGSFALVNGWGEYYGDPTHKLHADIQGIHSLIVPTGPSSTAERIYVSTDGGTYLLDLGTSAPQNLTQTGFRNAQYYSVRSSRLNPGTISAGAQDQGYQVSTATPGFIQWISGDYGHLTGSRPTNDMVWSVYPGFLLLQLDETSGALELPGSGTNFPSDPAIPWMPYILAHPDDPATILFGGQQLWRIQRTGPLAYANTSLWNFANGTNDQVGAVGVAPSNTSRVYVATYQGRLWYSSDGGASFTMSATVGPSSHYFYGSDILVSPTNPLVAFVCGSGYSGPGVYRTTDGGVTWSPYGTGAPATLFHALAFDNPVDQTVYAATEAGPYRCVAGVWQNLLTAVSGAPLTNYWGLESIPNQATVRFATYGRGLWDFHTGSTVAVGPESRAPRVRLAVGPNPTAAAATIDYTLPVDAEVRIEVFDLSGRRVAVPLAGARSAGHGRVHFDGRGTDGRVLASGIYLVRLESGAGREVARLFVQH